MKLPNADNTIVPVAKIVDYLLSATHPYGRQKASFFRSFGFTRRDWQGLVDALKRHARAHDVTAIETSPFGTRYVIKGIIDAPNGRAPRVRSVWFVDMGEVVPRLVTAYPLEIEDDD